MYASSCTHRFAHAKPVPRMMSAARRGNDRCMSRRVYSSMRSAALVITIRPPMSFPNVIVIDHPVVQTKLTELRDRSADHRTFRTLLNQIASLMVYEVTR